MKTILITLCATLADLLRSRASLQLEMLALRHQLAMVANRDSKRFRFRKSERIFWVWLYRLWPTCLQTLMIFKPDTLVRWHRKGFRLYWTWKSRPSQGGRPAIDTDVRKLIRTMSRNNIGWGAPLSCAKYYIKPPPAIHINRYSAFSIGNGRLKQLSRPALHQTPLPWVFSCLKMNALEHHFNKLETYQVSSANRDR